MSEPLTPEEEVRFRAFLRAGPPPHVTDGMAWRLLATLDAARSTSEGWSWCDCGCGNMLPARSTSEGLLPPRFLGFLVGQFMRAGFFKPGDARAAQATARGIVRDWNREYAALGWEDER